MLLFFNFNPMKKVIVAFIFFTSFFSQAQLRKQEVSLDIADALIIKTIEVSYEYYLSAQYSLGISGLVNLQRREASFRYNENTMFTPFFNYYLTTNKNWNYFGQVFVGINSGEKEIDLIGSNAKDYEKYTDGALGVALGTKFITNAGITISALAGVGRNLFSNNSPSLVPRIGLNIGYQF